MHLRTIASVTLALSFMAAAPSAFAAAGDSIVAGAASPTTINAFVGTTKAGFSYGETASAGYSQWPGSDGGPQEINLDGTTYRYLTAYLGGKSLDVIVMTAQGNGHRVGSHMWGVARGKLVLKGNVVWQDEKKYDVTAWAGSEAEVAKSQNVYNYDSPEATMGVQLGAINVSFTARYSGAVALNASAISDFNSNDGRHGIARGSTGGSVSLTTKAAWKSDIFGVLGFVVKGENKLSISYPATAIARWDYTSALPVDRRNSYFAAGTFPLTASATGRLYAEGIVWGNFEIGNIATWNEPELLKAVVKSDTATDVGAYE